MASSTDIPIRVLGPARIGGASAGLGPKQTLLLGALALRDGRVSTDEIIDLIWGDERPDNPKAALQVHVSRLRRALDAVGVALQYQADGYGLVADRDAVDVARFEDLVRSGSAAAADPTETRELLTEALELWQGRPLLGAADDTSLRADVDRLEELRLTAIEARVEAELRLGDDAGVVGELRRLLEDHPLHEGFRRLLLLALYRAGRAGEALAAYEEARTMLAEELGADPGPALRELHGRILEQDPALHAVHGSSAPTAPTAVSPTSPDPASVAVLPFEVLSDGPDATLLAAGLHIDLLTELSRVPGLTVTSRHSVLQLSPDATSTQVADELGVATMVVGSIRTAGRRFRLSVQLVDARTGAHRWAESYDHEVTPHDVLSVQQDLASDIARTISGELPTPSARRAPGRSASPTSSMEAYRLTVEARMQFDRKTEDGLRRSTELFRRAVVVDPDHGPAWVGLASALAMTADYGYGDRDELLDAAETTVVRALAMLPDTAEVHEALGLIAEGRFDAPRALEEYETAIHISPSNADAHTWHAWIHLTLGAPGPAVASARRAVALNPLSAEAVSNLGLALIGVGEPAAGLEEARRAEELSPGYTTAAYYAGLALRDLGREEDAIDVLTPLAVEAAGGLSTPWAGMGPDAVLALSLVDIGDEDAARRVLATIDPASFPVEAGVVRLALGDVDRAFDAFLTTAQVGYGGAMLRRLHLGDLWARVAGDPRLDVLDGHIGRCWNEPSGTPTAAEGASAG